MKPLDALLDTEISLKALTVQEAAIPNREHFRSAIGERRERRALFVRWSDHDGNWGLAECSCRPDPYFNGEFLDGAISVLRDFLFPRLPSRGTIRDVVAVAERVRGWPFTVAALLDALFDYMRRKGLADALDRWPTVPLARVPVGVSLPLFDTPEAAVEQVGAAVASGFRRVKLKVSPGMDLAPLRAVRDAFPAAYLGFDANGAIGGADSAFLEGLAACRPDVLEQPFPPGRLDLCAALKEHLPALRLCLDESVTGLGSLIAAHRLGALDEWNLKPGRVGGPLATLGMLEYCASHKIPVWVGGMFETGIGRAAHLRVAARLPEARAHDLSPPHRYLASDVVARPLTMDAEGYVAYDGRPVTPNDAVLQRFTVQEIVLRKT